jgi:hypothetical protein
VLIEETVTYLEMPAAEQLRPGHLPPAPVKMVKLDQDQAAASLLRRTYAQIAALLNWQSRRRWSDAQWEQLRARPQVHAWIARVGEEVAGVVELEAQPGGDVEIAVFGLVPAFIGRGLAPTCSPSPRGWPGSWSRRTAECSACGCTPPREILPTPSPTMNLAGSVRSGPATAA